MISLDPLRPYATAIKWGIIAALALGLVGGGTWAGCSMQAKRDASKIEAAERKAEKRSEALHAAAGALRQARNAFQSIGELTRQDAARAALVAAEGRRVARQAEKDRAAFERRQATLEDELQRERETCTEGRAKICGTPLR